MKKLFFMLTGLLRRPPVDKTGEAMFGQGGFLWDLELVDLRKGAQEEISLGRRSGHEIPCGSLDKTVSQRASMLTR